MGRLRARRFVLLPVFALLAGVVSLVHAVPAQANHAPGAVTNLGVVAAGSGELFLHWTKPAGTVTGYNVHYTLAPATGSGALADDAAGTGSNPSTQWVPGNYTSATPEPAPFHTVTGLTNGETYRVRVRPFNGSHSAPWAVGSGTPVNPDATVSFQLNTLLVVETDEEPAENVVLLSTALARSVTVAIGARPPDSAGGAAIEGRDFTLTPASVTFAPGETQKTFGFTAIADMVSDGGNEVTVLTLIPPSGIGVGSGAGVHRFNEVVIVDDSLEPFGLYVSQGARRQLALHWPPPTVSGHVLQGYDLHYTSSSAADDAAASGSDPSAGWVEVSLAEATATSHTISGLTDGRTYRLRLRYRTLDREDNEGLGDWVRATGTPSSPTSWQGYALTLSVDRQPSERGADVVVTLDLGRAAPPGFFAKLEGLPEGTAGSSLSWRTPTSKRLDLSDPQVKAAIESQASDWTMVGVKTQFVGIELGRDNEGGVIAKSKRNAKLQTFLRDWNGARSKSVRLRVFDDEAWDPGETIVLRATGYVGSPTVGHPWSGFGFSDLPSNTLVLTIVDDESGGAEDEPLAVGVSDALVYETDGATNNAPVTVWLSRTAAHDVTVGYATSPGSARPNADYTAVSGTVTIPAGDTTAQVVVPILDDGVEDSGEAFGLVLSGPSPSSVRLARSAATVTIRNDETELADLEAQGGTGVKGPWAPLDIGAFSPEVTDYAVTVPFETTHVQLRATPADETMSLAAGSDSARSAVRAGRWGRSVALEVGDNTMVMTASGPAGDVSTYRVTVTREQWAESSNTELRWLLAGGASNGAGPWTKLDIGALSPGRTHYTVTAPRTMTVARLLATPEHDAATLRSGVGSQLNPARPGYWSRGLPLTAGDNTFEVEVTAEDGTATTYTVTVTLAANTAPTVTAAIADATIADANGTHQVLLAGVFGDADADTLTFDAVSSARDVATAAVSGGTLTVTAVSQGSATITVTADDANGGNATATFEVTVPAAPAEQQQAQQAQQAAAVPGEVTGFSVRQTKPTRVRVDWDAPNEGSTVTAYEIVVTRDGDQHSKRRPGPKKQHVIIRKLEPGATYTITMRAKNAHGYGPPATAQITLTPQPPPS